MARAKSVEIPQDIIDSIIEEVYDTRLLKQLSLVSSSFLLPSRRQLFSRITLSNDQACQRIYRVLVHNSLNQSFVRDITVTSWGSGNTAWMNGTSLPAILRLPFRCLECFSINVPSDQLYLQFKPWNWNSFSSDLKDALSNIVHSPSLKTLFLESITNVPITFFLYIGHLKTLELRSVSPDDFRNENSSSLTPAASTGVGPTTSRVEIEQCVWHLNDLIVVHRSAHGPTASIFLPFICRLRFFEIYASLGAGTMRDFGVLSSLIGSLCMSLTSPATLERLEFDISFVGKTSNYFKFYEDLRDVWRLLDSITTHPTGSQLQRVSITIVYFLFQDVTAPVQPDANKVLEAVLDGLPLLRAKDILFVKAASSMGRARHEPRTGYCDVQPGTV